MADQRVSDTGFLVCSCGCTCAAVGVGLGFVAGLAWGAALTGLAGMAAGVILGALAGRSIAWLRRFARRDGRRAQEARDAQARAGTEERAKRGMAEKGYSWETRTLCPLCGKAQPAGRPRCSECDGQLQTQGGS